MLTKHLASLFERDIRKLKTEISSYSDETKLWITSAQISNSGGNLCLHLLGNLQYFIGSVLGKSGYIRNRPEEFSQKNILVKDMINTIDHTCLIVLNTLNGLTKELLEKDYPEKVFADTMTTEYFLLHLFGHLNYHLCQINYHRRLLDDYETAPGG